MYIHTAADDVSDYSTEQPYQINSCGKSRYATVDCMSIRQEGRRDYHVLYIAAGQCHAVFGERERVMTAGQFAVYYPHEPQQYYFRAAEGCVSCWVHFTGTAVAPTMRALGLVGGVYPAAPSAQVLTAFDGMTRGFTVGAPGNATEQVSRLLGLLAALSDAAAVHPTVSPLIAQVTARMTEELSLPYDAARYAALCALSVSRFTHRFRAETGLSPLGYFTRLKMREAERLLRFSDQPIGEIAAGLGYTGAFYFSRVFRAQTGVSPSSFRRGKSAK